MFENLIAFQAAQRPDAPALAQGDTQFSYSRMAADIGRCANWLAGLGLPFGGRALLHVPHPYVHWVLTFGLEQAGLSSATTATAAAMAGDLALLRGDVLFTSAAPEGPLSAPFHRIDQAWIDGLWAYPVTPPPRPARRGDDIVRIMLTSGTTGTAKKVPLTRDRLDLGIGTTNQTQLLSKPELRAIISVGPGSISGLSMPLACWALGGLMCHRAAPESWGEVLTRMRINVLRLAPSHLQDLLRDLPADFAPPPELVVGLIGGSLSPQLAQAAQGRLGADLVMTYGSTEAGFVALGRLDQMRGFEDSAGFVAPWARIEIVDPQGVPLPAGEIGEIRLTSDLLCDGYLEDPEASAAMFHDGWFWPGDLGTLDARGLLTVLGRTNDLMNIGGTKFLAGRLEALARAVAGVADAAAFLVADADGLEAPHLAYVAGEAPDLAALAATCRRALGRETPLMAVAAIPRNAMGKIQRDALAALRRPAPGAAPA